MISVLLLVFLLQLIIHLINTFGAQHINELLWLLYTKLPTPRSADGQSSDKLRREVVRLNREMNAVSAQDDLAKWARLRREHDKAKAKYDEKTGSLQSFRSTFDKAVSALRRAGTQGLQFFCNFYFSKSPMFWLPQNWVPYPVEWVLAFPRAPTGAVSINVWAMACAAVIAMMSEAVRGIWALRVGKVPEGEDKGQRLKMEAVGGKKGL